MKTFFYSNDKQISKKQFNDIVNKWSQESEESLEILNRNIEVVHGVDSKGEFTIEVYLNYDNMLLEIGL